MGRKFRKILYKLLALGLAVFLALSLWQLWGYYQTRRATDRAHQLVGIHLEEKDNGEKIVPQVQSPQTSAPAQSVPFQTAPGETLPEPEKPDPRLEPLDPEMAYLLELDLSPLQRENKDVLGWILVPGTQISYPLLHCDNNWEYLRHSWDGEYSAAGSIFMEGANRGNFQDYNTIIYGHNMRNGSCFADISKYRDPEFAQTHKYVYIVTKNEVRRYQVFSGYETPLNTHTYRLQFNQEETRKAALAFYLQSSLWQMEELPVLEDQILTLSTCTGTGTYDTRWVVQAWLTGVFPRT